MSFYLHRSKAVAAVAGSLALAVSAHAGTQVQVTIENLAPDMGTWLTPTWVGFHNGGYDLFDSGSAASTAMERLAEDGNNSVLMSEFMGNGAAQGVLGGAPIAPGTSASMTFSLDGSDMDARFLSFASMVLPSNDAFISNDDPGAFQIFANDGSFIGGSFMVMGSDVLDAGTEVNDEVAENTAFFGQMVGNTGDDENGVIGPHAGFIGSPGNPGTPSILADPMFANADFTAPGYMVARITVTQIPAPAGLALLGLAGLASRRRRA